MGALDRRIGLLFLVFIALLSIALLRATYLGSFKAPSLRKAAATQQVQTVTIPAPRGAITDRNGVELAVSEAADDVVADPYLIKNPQAAAQKLAPLLGKPEPAVLQLLTKPHTGFVYLAHLLGGTQGDAISKLNLAGISLIPETKREYPRVWAASQVLGSVGWGNRGLSGLEYKYNSLLRGQNGVRKIVSDAIGQPISVDDVRTTRPGKTLQLTIDAALQDEVEQVLAGVGAEYQPKGATAIVMDPNTGQILALANWPRINANDPGLGAVVRERGPGSRVQLRAGLDLQGIHRRGRAPGRRRHPEHAVQHPVGAPGRRPADPRRRGPRRRDACRSPTSSSSRATSAPTRSG